MRYGILIIAVLIIAIGGALLGYSNVMFDITGNMDDVRYNGMSGPLLFLFASMIVLLSDKNLRGRDSKVFLISLGPVILSSYAIANSMLSV